MYLVQLCLSLCHTILGDCRTLSPKLQRNRERMEIHLHPLTFWCIHSSLGVCASPTPKDCSTLSPKVTERQREDGNPPPSLFDTHFSLGVCASHIPKDIIGKND